MKFFNFYVENSVWSHGRLPQGWCGSPKIASEAMQETFHPTVMPDFKKAKNIKDADFHYHNYESLLDQFVDDLAVYTPKVTPDNYTGTFSPMKMHFTAIESIFYALNRFDWLILLRKSTIAKLTFVLLGAKSNLEHG